MKTAILISGHMRSFDRCLPTLHWHVFRHFVPLAPGSKSVCDFFISTEPDADAAKAYLLSAKYPNCTVSIDTAPQPDMAPYVPPPTNPAWTKPETGVFHNHEPYNISVPPTWVAGQLWRLEHCYAMVDNPDEDYDLFIRCRPDLYFHSSSGLREIVHSDHARTPWWGRFGGVNDRFALLGVEAAHRYFTTFSRLRSHMDAGAPFHPESLLFASLSLGNCEIDDTLRVEFSTMRSNGELRWPEVSPFDIAHYHGCPLSPPLPLPLS